MRGVRAFITDMAARPRVPLHGRARRLRGRPRSRHHSPAPSSTASELYELIQFRPQTPKVHTTPLLIVPPTINKYYVLDLAPGRSLIEFLVGQGHQVFTISWRNPDASFRDSGLDAYGGAVVDALDAVRTHRQQRARQPDGGRAPAASSPRW